MANQEMVRALRVSTVERGVDPREFALMPFGGAGPMHAAAIASELDMRRILCPRAGGVLSALGLLASERRRDTARTVMLRGEELTADRIAEEVEALRGSIAQEMGEAKTETAYELRYRGQAFELPIPAPARPDPAALAERFASEHEARYGYRDPDAEVELVTIRVALVADGARRHPGRGRGRHLGKHPARSLRRRVGAGARAAGGAGRGPRGRGTVRLRAPGGNLGPPEGMDGRGRPPRDRRREPRAS